MSKKNSNAILKNGFKDHTYLSNIYNLFYKKLKSLKKNNFAIAVSGGSDSLALSALAKAYSYQHKCKIHYILVNHNLRKNSTKEAKSVKKFLKKYKINLNILENKKFIDQNIQSQAREVRYQLITDFCKKKKIKAILTAHNLEDQVETFFIRLSRGSGLNGLSSMRETRKIRDNIILARPLLDVKKNQLIKISNIIFGKYYKDPSNVNKKYLRTRIRNFKKTLEASGINYDQIFKSIKNLASSRDTLNLYFDNIYMKITKKKKKKILINLKDFYSYNDETKMRVFEKSIKDLTNAYYSPRSKKILNLIEVLKIKEKNNAKLTLGGTAVYKDKNLIILEKDKKN